jgi:hypothetical protein
MTNVRAMASGGTDNRGIHNYDQSNPTMTNVTARAHAGTYNYGVYNDDSSEPTIRRSTIFSETSLYGSFAWVSQSTLRGGVFGGADNKCVACDDGHGNALGANCL